MNPVHPKKLLHSKWTKVNVTNKLKHFTVCEVEYDDNHKVIRCEIRAEMNQQQWQINWRELKNSALWRQGWQ